MTRLTAILTWLLFAAAGMASPAIDADLSKGQPYFDARGQQVGWLSHETGQYRPYDAASGTFGAACAIPAGVSSVAAEAGCLGEVNAQRAQRGLRPYIFDAGLTQAAQAAAAYRAAHHMQGHTANDFAFLPPGSTASAAGCAGNDPSWGFMACVMFETGYTYAGAASVMGSDNRRYCHLFVR